MSKVYSTLYALIILSLFFIQDTKARVVGPDSYGYIAVDSNEPWGPTFDWIDITATGNYWPHGDDDYIEVPIGFTFNFYGTDYDRVYINSNGSLTFVGGDLDWVNEEFPLFDNLPRISPFWDDLIRHEVDAGVYYQTLGTAPNRMFVVTWYIEDHFYGTPSEVTFQVILYEGTNQIKFQYLDTIFGNPSFDNGASATVGLNKGDGITALLYSYNEPIIYDGMAILISTGIVNVNPSNIDFEYVKINRTDYKEFTIKNDAPINVDIDSFILTGDNVFTLDINRGDEPCGEPPFTLTPGQSCEVYVAFSPQEERNYNANLQINTSLKTFNLPITGIGDYPVIEIRGLDDQNYKSIVRGDTNIIEIYNPSNVPLELIDIYIESIRGFELDLTAGDQPCDLFLGDIFLSSKEGAINSQGIRLVNFYEVEIVDGLPPGEYCTIGIRFFGSDERKINRLYIETDDPLNPLITIILQSTGFIEGIIDNAIEGKSATGSSKGGCNFVSINSLPFYLLIPVLIVFRRFIKNL